jgi:hypothetical protein
MLNFIKRLFVLCLTLLVAAGIWGYYQGMGLSDYKELLSDFFDEKDHEEEQAPVVETITDEPKDTTPPTPKEETDYRLQPLPHNPFSTVDRHARKAPASVTKDVQLLASYLQEKSNTDLEKARAIFTWMAENISYDDEAFNSGNYPNYTAEYVLKNRRAVCDGYSNLFLALGNEMGIEVTKITGYAKGYGFQQGNTFNETDHAWNAVFLDGRWKIMDATWGSCFGENVKGKLRTTKVFNDYWFDVDPYEAIFSHYPEDPSLSFVSPSISLTQYEQMPKVEEGYFKLGFDGRATYFYVSGNPDAEFPMIYKQETYVKVLAAPKYNQLNTNQIYDFELFVPRAYEVALIDAKNEWTHFKRKKGRFLLSYTPTNPGKLRLSLKLEKDASSFSTIMAYEVLDEPLVQ